MIERINVASGSSKGYHDASVSSSINADWSNYRVLLLASKLTRRLEVDT